MIRLATPGKNYENKDMFAEAKGKEHIILYSAQYSHLYSNAKKKILKA